MKKRQLDHVLRAAGKIVGDKEFIIIGSQALHGTCPDIVDAISISAEVDLISKNHPEITENLNAIGVASPFHQEFGYYADPVDRDTAKLPQHWERRLVALTPGDTQGVTGWCLEPHDLAIAKYVAAREKDRVFVKALIGRKLIALDRLLELIELTPVAEETRARMRATVKSDFAAAAKPPRRR